MDWFYGKYFKIVYGFKRVRDNFGWWRFYLNLNEYPVAISELFWDHLNDYLI